MKVEVIGVTNVDAIWPLVIKDVVRCLKKAHPAAVEVTPADVWANCRNGSWVMIVAHDEERGICAVTVWKFSPNGYFDCALMAGKDMRLWLEDVVNAAFAIAREHDCRGFSATARPQFTRAIMKVLPTARIVSQTYAMEF